MSRAARGPHAALALVVIAACERAPAPRKQYDARPPDPPPPNDIAIAIDASKSMEEIDLPPDRFGAAKAAVRRFIAGRRAGDRFAIVVFGQQPRVMVPLTGDLTALDDAIAKLDLGDVPYYGTAMGDGVAAATAELAGSPPGHRDVIVIADGDSNWVVHLDPYQAAADAKTAGIPISTIVIGRPDPGAMPVDPTLLTMFAVTTGGTFATAEDAGALDHALGAIRATADRRRDPRPRGSP